MSKGPWNLDFTYPCATVIFGDWGDVARSLRHHALPSCQCPQIRSLGMKPVSGTMLLQCKGESRSSLRFWSILGATLGIHKLKWHSRNAKFHSQNGILWLEHCKNLILGATPSIDENLHEGFSFAPESVENWGGPRASDQGDLRNHGRCAALSRWRCKISEPSRDHLPPDCRLYQCKGGLGCPWSENAAFPLFSPYNALGGIRSLLLCLFLSLASHKRGYCGNKSESVKCRFSAELLELEKYSRWRTATKK